MHFNQANLITSDWKPGVLRFNEQSIIASRLRHDVYLFFALVSDFRIEVSDCLAIASEQLHDDINAALFAVQTRVLSFVVRDWVSVFFAARQLRFDGPAGF